MLVIMSNLLPLKQFIEQFFWFLVVVGKLLDILLISICWSLTSLSLSLLPTEDKEG